MFFQDGKELFVVRMPAVVFGLVVNVRGWVAGWLGSSLRAPSQASASRTTTVGPVTTTVELKWMICSPNGNPTRCNC